MKQVAMGTVEANPVSSSTFVHSNTGVAGSGQQIRRTLDADIASGGAFLTSELEKRDTLIREPLTSLTYPRDIPVKVGGGWIEFITALNIDYGVTGSNVNSPVLAPGSNMPPVVQANFEKDIFRTHVFSVALRIKFIDMQRGNLIGRPLDRMLTDGVRLTYDKHMDANVYVGMSEYDTTGLVNSPDIPATNVANGAGGATQWGSKTPDEILIDINNAISAGWEAAAWSLEGIPNHILLPYAQYNMLATTRVSELAEKTILTFLLENNVATQNGTQLQIGAVSWLKGAGAGGTDRMVSYINNDRFVAVEELVPLSRIMTGQNLDAVAYDSIYNANISEVELFYPQIFHYFDGI